MQPKFAKHWQVKRYKAIIKGCERRNRMFPARHDKPSKEIFNKSPDDILGSPDAYFIAYGEYFGSQASRMRNRCMAITAAAVGLLVVIGFSYIPFAKMPDVVGDTFISFVSGYFQSYYTFFLDLPFPKDQFDWFTGWKKEKAALEKTRFSSLN